MKILLATYSLRNWTGSELFTADLARSLATRGHEIHLHAPLLGALSQRLSEEGLSVTGLLTDLSADAFDIAHVHHNLVAVGVRATFPQLPMVMLLHGVLPELEQPPSIDLGIREFICVSEEVRDHALARGIHGADTRIIRNFISGQHWRPTTPVGQRLSRVLVLSNDYSRQMRTVVEAACASIGARVKHVGLPDNPKYDVRPHISGADLVITLGRGALEAMAMERNVLVYGPNGGDGFVDEESFHSFKQRNFSGRTARLVFTPDTLAQEMLRFDPALGGVLRGLALAECEEGEIVSKLESVYHQHVLDQVRSPANLPPLRREYLTLYRELHDLNEEADLALAALRGSASWRATAPMRRILTWVRRTRRGRPDLEPR